MEWLCVLVLLVLSISAGDWSVSLSGSRVGAPTPVEWFLFHFERFFSSLPSPTPHKPGSGAVVPEQHQERGGRRIWSSRSSTFRVPLKYLKSSLRGRSGGNIRGKFRASPKCYIFILLLSWARPMGVVISLLPGSPPHRAEDSGGGQCAEPCQSEGAPRASTMAR